MAKKKGNEIEIQGDITAIYIGTGATTIIDTEDLKLLEDNTVYYNKASGYFYVVRNKKIILLHRLINNTPKDKVTDHISRDKADNRKINLKTCTQYENMLNRKDTLDEINHVEGISYHKRTNRWQVLINTSEGKKHICYRKSKQEAIKAKELAEQNYKETHTINSKANKPLAIQRQRLWQ